MFAVPRRSYCARPTPKSPPPADDTCVAADEHVGPANEGGTDMIVVYVLVALALLAVAGLALGVRIIKQYERGVLFRLGRVKGDARGPGLIAFVPFVDQLH